MKNTIFFILAIMALNSCTVCRLDGAYSPTTDKGQICLNCDKISQSIQNVIDKKPFKKILIP